MGMLDGINRIAKFEKISFEQYRKDFIDTFVKTYDDGLFELLDLNLPQIKGSMNLENIMRTIYDSIKLPKRATCGSAGYDFFMPIKTTIGVDKSVKIPTGIRCKMENGWVLTEFPRSGHGFKYGIHMANSVGIIDGDYYSSDNEGHIFIKLVNDSILAKPLTIKAGEAFCQGIFLPYGITYDDNVTKIRNGGLGSTSK